MKTLFKKLSCVIASILLFFSTGAYGALAQENDSVGELVGLSYSNQMPNSGARSQSYPKNVLNIAQHGPYSMYGKVNWGAGLYTNYRFTGKSSYKLRLKNLSNSTIQVWVMKKEFFTDSRVEVYNLNAQENNLRTISGLSTNDEIYIFFQNNNQEYYEFSGAIA